MKIIFLGLFSSILLVAESQIYYAKTEPKIEYVIKSEVSGRVLFVNEDLEGRVSKGEILVRIDDFADKVNLRNKKNRLKSSKIVLKSINQSLKNLQAILRIKEKNFQKINSLKSRSIFEKDLEKVALLNIKNSYQQMLQQKQQTLSTISDFDTQIKILQDNIKKKSIFVKKGFYIYSIDIKKDDFLSVGRVVLKTADLSQAKLTIFVDVDESKEIQNKQIFIDEQKTNYKIDKIWKVADSKNISSYRVEILIDKPKKFSKLKKIYFK